MLELTMTFTDEEARTLALLSHTWGRGNPEDLEETARKALMSFATDIVECVPGDLRDDGRPPFIVLEGGRS